MEGLNANAIEGLELSEKKNTVSKRTKGKLLTAQKDLRGICGFANTVSRTDVETRDYIDELTDEIMVKGDAYQILPLLEELVGLIRARVVRADRLVHKVKSATAVALLILIT